MAEDDFTPPSPDERVDEFQPPPIESRVQTEEPPPPISFGQAFLGGSSGAQTDVLEARDVAPAVQSGVEAVAGALPEAASAAQSAAQTTINPLSYVSEALTPQPVKEFMRTPIVPVEAIDTARQAAQYPEQTLSNILFGTQFQEQGPLSGVGRFASEQIAGQTTPENLAIIAGTAGVGAAEGILAKKAPSLAEILFGARAVDPLVPLTQSVVQAPTTESVLESEARRITGNGEVPNFNPHATEAEVAAIREPPPIPEQIGATPETPPAVTETVPTGTGEAVSERLQQPAIRLPDGQVFTGENHGVAMDAVPPGTVKPGEHVELGFSTDQRPFVENEEAFKIAKTYAPSVRPRADVGLDTIGAREAGALSPVPAAEGATTAATPDVSGNKTPVAQTPAAGTGEGFTPKGDFPVSDNSLAQARAEYPEKPNGWTQERYDIFIRQRAGAIEDEVRRNAPSVPSAIEPTTSKTSQEIPTGSVTPETPQTVGAASREEYMQRYQALGASKILEGHTELGKFSQEMMKSEPSIPKDDLNEIFNRSKQVVNNLQTAGQSKSQISEYIRKELSKPKPASFENVRVRPISALKDQYKAAEKAGTVGFKRGLSEGRAEGTAAAAQIRQELAMSDKWMAGDQEQVRQNMVDYVNATLPPAERGRFIGAITRALRRPALRSGVAQSGPDVMYRHAFNVMKAIENRAGEVYKGNVIEDIKSTLSKSLDAPGVDVAYRRQLKSIADTISGTKPTEQTLSRLRGLQDFVNRERAAGREPNIPQEHLDELSKLTQLPLKKMPIEALEQLQQRVNNLASLGRVKAKLMERMWEREKANSVKEFQASEATPIESRPTFRPQPTERLTVGQKFMNSVAKTVNNASTFENAIRPIDETYDLLDASNGQYNGWASRNIKGKIDLAYNEREAQRQPIINESRRIIKQNGLKTSDLETIHTKAVIDMIGRERLEAMGVRPDILDKIEKTPLTEGQQKLSDFYRKNYDAMGAQISDVAHRLYQIDMKPVEGYVPLERDWASHLDSAQPEPLTDPSVGEVPFNEKANLTQLQRDVNPKILSRTEQGFLKDRIEGAKTAIKLNGQQVFERHITDAAHFVNSQPTLKMLGEIVRTPEFAAKYGKTGQNIILDNLDTVANNGYVGKNGRIAFLDWIRNSTSKGAVGFRVASNFVHASQIPYAMNHAGGIQWWKKGLELSLTPEGQSFLRKNAAETYARSGGEPAQAEAEATMSKVGKAGFFVARNLDKLNAQATFMGRYAKEMSAKGINPDDVLSAAVDKDAQSLALRRMHRAVASPLAKDLPQMTSRGALTGGNVSVARTLNQFRNIFFDNYSNVRHDILRVGVDKMKDVVNSLRAGEIAQGARHVGDFSSHEAAIAAAVLASIAMETAIKMGIKKGITSGMSAITGTTPTPVKGQEEKTFLGELQHHALNRIPFAGQIISAIKYGETGIPTIDAIVKPLHEVGTYLASRKPETKAKHLTRAVSGAATVTGIPGSSQALEAFEPQITKTLGKYLPDTSKKKVVTGRKNEYGF